MKNPNTLKHIAVGVIAVSALAFNVSASATGLATCDSGDKSTWQPVEKLQKDLEAKGWTVRRIKEDGGCYEVYAMDEKSQRGEFYFHPVTLAPVPTSAKGRHH